jgi:hypothetical protein
MMRVAIELTPQAEAEHIAALSAAIIYQEQQLVLLVTAGCTREEVAASMECE